MQTLKLGSKIDWEYTDDIKKAEYWLSILPSEFSADFETAVKFSRDEIEEFKRKANDESLPTLVRREYLAKANATPFHHPSWVKVTHISLGYAEDVAKVIILKDKEITELVMDFLVSTDKRQIWHNAPYDFRFIYYHTGKFPRVYEDTNQLAKSLTNHVDRLKGKTGLKDLMGYKYGKWAIAKDSFTIENMYDKQLLEYAAIDACATMGLWNELQTFIEMERQEEMKSGENIIFPYDPSIPF